MTPDMLITTPDFRIPSHRSKRDILLKHLRPGDWLEGPTGIRFCVYAHKAKKQELSLWQRGRPAYPFTYAEILSLNYVGRGKPRMWLGLLPDWAIGNTCLFSQP